MDVDKTWCKMSTLKIVGRI